MNSYDPAGLEIVKLKLTETERRAEPLGRYLMEMMQILKLEETWKSVSQQGYIQ